MPKRCRMCFVWGVLMRYIVASVETCTVFFRSTLFRDYERMVSAHLVSVLVECFEVNEHIPVRLWYSASLENDEGSYSRRGSKKVVHLFRDKSRY